MESIRPDQIDSLLHTPKRLVAMAIVAASDQADFAYLRDRLGLSDSDTSKQMAALAEAGLVKMHKTGRGPKSRTTFTATAAGRAEFDRHSTVLQSLITNPNNGATTMITYDSPIGPLHLARTAKGLVRVGFGEIESSDEFAADVHERVGDDVYDSATGFAQIVSEFDEYFAQDRQRWTVPVDWQLISGFRRDALEAAFAIPCGEVRSYGELAAEAGSPNASRAVGTAMSTNPIPVVLPCHRIVKADRSLGNYLGGVPVKQQLLELEGAV